METADYIAEQRLLGGHPALDFVNSGDGEGGPEYVECLRTYEDLVAWAHRAGIVTEAAGDGLIAEASRRPAEADQVLRRALRIRDDLDRLFRAIATRGSPPRAAVRHLGDAHAEALAHAKLIQDGGRFTWSWSEGRDLREVLWRVVHTATELATSEALGRVKVCAGCRWLFCDASKNHSRRWCAMEDGCGSEAKMKKYVARRAARKTKTR
ncbi:MAG: CGNR zinc finger domain-containing protein [Actinomycetota bacterium]